jgi:stringent starvation protein B
VSFEARFSGVPRLLRFPAAAVQGIYARETGEGLMFPPGEDDSPPDSPPASPIDPNPSGPIPDRGAPPASPTGGKRPTLKVVK